MVAAIILAAGSSTRMGRPKQLLEVCGQTLVRRTALCALEAGCRPVIIVTGAHAQETREALNGLEVVCVKNDLWELGLGSSIRAGVATVLQSDSETEAIVIMVCDQPLVRPETIVNLIAVYRDTSCSIVPSSYGGTLGVPALFNRKHFGELAGLDNAQGAKQIIHRHAANAHGVEFPEGAIDIDTPEDLAGLR